LPVSFALGAIDLKLCFKSIALSFALSFAKSFALFFFVKKKKTNPLPDIAEGDVMRFCRASIPSWFLSFAPQNLGQSIA